MRGKSQTKETTVEKTNDLIQQIDAFNHLLNKHRLTHQDQ